MSKGLLLAALALATTVAFAPAGAWAHPSTAPRKTLTAFANEQELADLFKRWAEERRRFEETRRATAKPEMAAQGVMADAQTAAPSAKAAAEADSVTNVQHAGVDEGGIVKLHGEHLVILRRGRVFTVGIANAQLKPISAVDAFGPDVDPSGTWYDEMLISGNTIAVIGYSYTRGGTEVGLFRVSATGELTHKGTYQLRSNDYYSSRNYASRLIGSKLVFYSPLYLNPWAGDPFAAFPAMRKWRPGAAPPEFKRIAPATRIYRTDEPLDPYAGVALHSVSVCDLARPELDCQSTAVMGPPGRVFYVSPSSVFVWTTTWRQAGATSKASSSVFRIPLDGSAPSALKAAGSPIDQFSFLEGEDGMLNVLVQSDGQGDGMWMAEQHPSDLALLRVPLASFSDGTESAPRRSYRALPKPEGYALQSRYIGAYLLYGAGTGWHRPRNAPQSQVYAVRYERDAAIHEIPLVHSVDRIEALGADAVVVGSDGKDLHFTSLRLNGSPVVVDHYVHKDAAQGETRSHGFYYRPENEQEGLLGLPMIGGGESAARQLRAQSAALLYLRNRGLSLSELGTLDARPGAGERNDACRASCVDWYGNSRPLFVRGRVFALLGYEIVEGAVTDTRIFETRRISFAPRTDEISR